MPEDKSPEDEIDLALEHETQKERLAKNRFYNPELDQGDPTPHWVNEIEAFFEMAFWLFTAIAAFVFVFWIVMRSLGFFA